MTIQPLFDQILIKPVEDTGILHGDNVLICEYGEIVALGEEVTNVKVGDTLAFVKWGTNDVEINGTKHYFIKNEGQFVLGKIIW